MIRKLVRAKEIMEDLDEQRIWQCVGRAKFETKDEATNFYLERESLVNKMCKEIQNLEAIKEHPQVQVQPGHFHVSRGYVSFEKSILMFIRNPGQPSTWV